jgi:choline dehydrogenase-like flavoprotein
VLEAFASRTIDIYLESEDLPEKTNRVLVDSQGNITINWKPNNLTAHNELTKQAQSALRRAGFLFVFKQRMGIETNSHMCGTLVAGRDPRNSVLDQYCRSHEVENLFVVDSSFFPSSAAANPALTIAAQAYRVAAEGDVLR